MEYLRGRASGMSIPTFVVDAPHGGGKIPILPNYIVSMSPTHIALRNYEGLIVNYPEPGNYKESLNYNDEDKGVFALLNGQISSIQPLNIDRIGRRENFIKSNIIDF
jgi:lysine 2,3-aminomutase